MKYTIQRGARVPFSERFSNKTLFVLPLLVLLAGVFFYTLNPLHIRKSASPSTLGVYTVNTENSVDGKKPASSNDSNTTANTTSSPGGLSQQESMAASGGSNNSSTGSSAATSPVTTGGMGGGAAAPPTATVTTTVATTGCTIGTLTTPSVCGTCTTPINLTGAQKAILTASGACIAVDP